LHEWLVNRKTCCVPTYLSVMYPPPIAMTLFFRMMGVVGASGQRSTVPTFVGESKFCWVSREFRNFGVKWKKRRVANSPYLGNMQRGQVPPTRLKGVRVSGCRSIVLVQRSAIAPLTPWPLARFIAPLTPIEPVKGVQKNTPFASQMTRMTNDDHKETEARPASFSKCRALAVSLRD
jgi:hypothetical protein